MSTDKTIQFKNYELSDLEIKKSKDDAREFTGIISAQTLDLDKEVLLGSGMNSSGFTGTVLYNHNKDMPIGKSLSIRKSGNNLIGKAKLADEGTDELIDKIWSLMKQGIIKGVSVGFQVIEQRVPTKQDIKEFGKEVRNVISKWRLLEFSVVTVPANQAALITAVKSMDLNPKDFIPDYKEEIEDSQKGNQKEIENIVEQVEKELEVKIEDEVKDKIIEVVKQQKVDMKEVLKYFREEVGRQIRKSRGELF